MIVDSFIFFNELDVLDIRLEELYPVVDRFVLVESDTTFQGMNKPYNFAANIDRYSKYMDKIVYHNFVMPHLDVTWERETAQRNAIADVLKTCGLPLDTIVIMSDVDEIPSRAVVKEIKFSYDAGVQQPLSLWLKKFSYAINVLTTERHGSVKAFPYSYLKGRTPNEIRKTDIAPYIYDAGWEFSSLGSAEQVSEKLKSFSHSELNVDGVSDVHSIRRRMRALEDVAGRGYKHALVEIDDTWPEAIKHNRQYWSKYEWRK